MLGPEKKRGVRHNILGAPLTACTLFFCVLPAYFGLQYWQVEGEVRRSKLLDKAKKRRRPEEGDPASEVASLPEASGKEVTPVVGHFNLFEGVVPPEVVGKAKGGGQSLKAEAEGAAEDAKHRLGYGCVSGADGVAKPWYLERSKLKDEAKKEEVRGRLVGKALEGRCWHSCLFCPLGGYAEVFFWFH